jgi:predicted nucleotide-binding protein
MDAGLVNYPHFALLRREPMARRTAQPPAEVPLFLTMPREETSHKITERIESGIELKSRSIRDHQTFQDTQRSYWTWSEYNEEMLRQMFTSPKIAEEYGGFGGIFAIGREPSLGEQIADLHRSIDSKVRKLTSVQERLELLPLSAGMGQPPPLSKASPAVASGKVFVVHGHDEGVRETVARFIGHLGLTPIILHEQASQGRTIVEKLERHGDVGYAVVLLTPDDVGGTDPAKLQPRARQNVILELGYFLGRLGRDRVCGLYRGELELPSDYMGVIYIRFDSGGGWRLSLAKELKAADFDVDMNKAL